MRDEPVVDGSTKDLKCELESLLNSFSRENASNTPDFILAEYMMSCLDAFERATKRRDGWYGMEPCPGQRRETVMDTNDVEQKQSEDNDSRKPGRSNRDGHALLGVSSRWSEEMVVTPPAGMKGWKLWRVAYSLPDGHEVEYTIMLPPEADPRKLTRTLQADDVEWIVNDNAELGVRIHGQCFFLYKGDSLVYDNARHDDGSPMYVRTVGKREFGECCHPINDVNPLMKGTVSLDDCDRWEMMSPDFTAMQVTMWR